MRCICFLGKRRNLVSCLALFTSAYVIIYVIPVHLKVLQNTQHVKLDKRLVKHNQSSVRPYLTPPPPHSVDAVKSVLTRKTHRPYDRIYEALLKPRTLDSPNTMKTPKLVLILAYMHTGSSYVGSVLQNHPGTFYWYEALRSLQDETRQNQTSVFLNSTTRNLSGTYVDPDVGAEAAANMLRCDHDKLDIATLARDYYRDRTDVIRDTAPFYDCQGRPKWRDKNNQDIKRRQAVEKALYFTSESKQRIRRCLPYLDNKCKGAKVRILKLIRMTMETGELLLKTLPDLKLIYLVRDPRAMLNSQERRNDYGARQMPVFVEETKRMCARMLTDIHLSHQIKLKYKERIMRIRYENIAEEPLESAVSMLKLVGLTFAQADEAFVRKMSIDTIKNSREREKLWRAHLDQKHLDIIDKYCEPVYHQLGYLKYDHIEDIRNLSKPTYTKSEMFSSVNGF